jgi:glutathione S-transferase
MGTAPVISDGELVLAESGAIVDYIIARHGGGRLALTPTHLDYPKYLYWFHFANSNLQALLHRYLIVRRLEAAPDNPTLLDIEARLGKALNMTDKRLGAADYLAGKEFTAADIIVFSLTTMRTFIPFDLAPYPNVLSYLRRIGEREGYRRAMQTGDPDRVPLLT